MDGERVVTQSIAPVRCHASADQNLAEEGAGVVAQIPVGDFEVGWELALQREAVEGLPFPAKRSFEHKPVFKRQQAVRFLRRGLHDVWFQAKGRCKHIPAKSY